MFNKEGVTNIVREKTSRTLGGKTENREGESPLRVRVHRTVYVVTMVGEDALTRETRTREDEDVDQSEHSDDKRSDVNSEIEEVQAEQLKILQEEVRSLRNNQSSEFQRLQDSDKYSACPVEN